MSGRDTTPATDCGRLVLSDPTGQIVRECELPEMKQKDVAITYALAMRDEDIAPVDWKRANEAIRDRWSLAGLERVKKIAWKMFRTKSTEGKAPVESVTAVLVDQDGRVMRRVRTPSTTTFLLNLRDGHYYDRQPCCGRFMRRAHTPPPRTTAAERASDRAAAKRMLDDMYGGADD